MADVRQLFQQAVAAMRGGDIVVAETLFKRVLKRHPKDAGTLFMLGNLKIHQGRHRDAAGYLKKAVLADPANGAAWVNLGSTLKALNKPGEAINCYQKAIGLAPEMAVAHSSLGSVLKEQGRLEAAERHCREAVRLEPNNPDGHVNLGVVRKERGDPVEAEACYRRALELNPEMGQAHVNLGLVLEATGRADEAIGCFARALELRSQNQAARAHLGHAYLVRGAYEEAADCYRTALMAQPDDWQLHINYGLALAEHGSPERMAALERLKADHVYRSMDEPIALGKTLAAGYPVPPEYERAPLTAFFDQFDPDSVYPESWWRARRDAFGDPVEGRDKMLRGSFAKIYAWSMPSAEALAALAEVIGPRRLASYGAGSGYWEYLLARHHGIDVVAGDLHLNHRFIEMQRQDFGTATPDPADVVMFAWIIEAQNVVDAALALMDRMVPGQQLILMGDRPEDDGTPRTCGTPALFDYLKRHFERRQSVELVSFSYLYDGIDCYVRR